MSAEVVLLAIASGIVFPTLFKLIYPCPKDAEYPSEEEASSDQNGG
jgi:hypothetical protein